MRKPIHSLNMLSTSEYSKLVDEFSHGAVVNRKETCIITLFEKHVAESPNEIALAFGNVEFTYLQINAMANSVALELKEFGVKKNDIVAIISKRSYQIVVAIIAIMKVGAAYLPVDYNYPYERIDYILKDSGCKAVLTFGVNMEVDKQLKMENIDYSNEAGNFQIQNTNTDLCAIIYTSGSTGEPKGTLLQHKGVVNFAFANDALYSGGSCVISFATYTFDAFLLETILPMIRGVKCVLATELGSHWLITLPSTAKTTSDSHSRMERKLKSETQTAYYRKKRGRHFL